MGALFIGASPFAGCSWTNSSSNDPQVNPGASSATTDGGIDNPPNPGFGDSATSTSDDSSTSFFGDEGIPSFDAPEPSFGTTVQAATPPPPIAGGTLAVNVTSGLLVAADPDRDLVHVVTLAGAVRDVALTTGDEPGRVTFGGANTVYVVLRGTGQVATIATDSATVKAKTNVCPVPRGIAWDATRSTVWVSCMGGELVALTTSGAKVIRRDLDDARDVVVHGTGLLVSRFRQAGVYSLTAADLDPTKPTPTPTWTPALAGDVLHSPTLAFRLAPAPPIGALLVHQEALNQVAKPIDTTTPGGYSSGSPTCPEAIAKTSVTRFGATADRYGSVASAVLALDIAAIDGKNFGLIATGNALMPDEPTIFMARPDAPTDPCGNAMLAATVRGQPVAIATDGSNYYVQTREPAGISVIPIAAVSSPPAVRNVIPLASDSHKDTGHDIFHSSAGGHIACASCHAEGGEDGHIWFFMPQGFRRTQSLRGGAINAAPYHWSGDETSFDRLMKDVFVNRMLGTPLDRGQMNAAIHWLGSLANLPTRSGGDAAAIAAGKALFESKVVGCSGCHGGAALTNHSIVDVGTTNSGAGIVGATTFKTPSLLGVSYRDPFMHDGCATDLSKRFDPACGGSNHGDVSSLGTTDMSHLIAYLKSL